MSADETDLYAELRWLPPAPVDFAARLRALPAAPDAELRRLAGYALNLDQLVALAKRADGVRLAEDPALRPLRLGLVSNATTAFLAPALVATGLRYSLALAVSDPGYNQVAQAVLDPASALYAAKPEIVLLALDLRALPLTPCPGDAEAAAMATTRAVDYVLELAAALQRHGIAKVVVQTAPAASDTLFGSFDVCLPGTLRHLQQGFNRELCARLPRGVHLLDVDALASTVGLALWHDPQQWHAAKLPFRPELTPLYADYVLRVVAALCGKLRKVLALDLDNTLWGGTIGDDGLEGITIGQGSALGEAYLAVHRMALDLAARGIVLVVCSKNDEATARLPFAGHPDMLLREEHFAVFCANWTDKAANLRAIAQTLDLGLDSFVLLDDNPAERAQVRFELPEVATPEIGDDPALYPRLLAAGGYFEAVSFTAEDRKRAAYYAENSKRATLLAQASNIDDYLKSLDMEIIFAPFDELGRARIAQLIGRSNQFNLTTRRYGESEIMNLEADPRAFTLQVRLADRFGDNGMISVVICHKRPAEWEIDTWLMSCRVLGRRVENAILEELARNAADEGARALVGLYVPSGRNTMVKDHYAKLGFSLVAEEPDGKTTWRFDLTGRRAPGGLPMRIVRAAGAALARSAIA